jgi:two-component system nitrate/nitrite sensor histidine kinase NarX
MQNILNIFKTLRTYIINHKLYANLHLLVFSLVLTVIIIQASSLFLYDYIPNHLATINQAYKDQSVWKLELYKLESRPKLESADFIHLNANLSHFNDQTYVWSKTQHDTKLADAYSKLHQAHQKFSAARVRGVAKDRLLESARAVIAAYDEFIEASQSDVIIKQSVVQIMQLVCVFITILIGSCIMFATWGILITRLGKIYDLIPQDLLLEDKNYQYDDELERLEKLTAEMSARLEGYQVESTWTNKNSMERMRKMLLSQDFLFKLAKLVAKSDLSEMTIKKVLYSMESTLAVKNVALVFSENGSRITTQRALYSHNWPLSFDESMFDSSLHMLAVNHETKLIKGECIQCVTIPLPGPSSWLAMLLIETEANHYFEDTEIQLIEVTSQMLALSMGFQAREQEGRRVALLEERAVIARELHDSLAQSLSYMKFQLARLQTNYGPGLLESGASVIVDDMREGLDNAYRELRELLTTFRVQMDVRGLDHVLEETINEFSNRSNLSITLDNRLQECRLTVNEEFHLLHVIREALSNIVRHSGADKVTISLVLQSTGDVVVTIDDNGIGSAFDESKPHHYGLAIMTERAHCLGGSIEIRPRRLGGTRVRLQFRPKSDGI